MSSKRLIRNIRWLGYSGILISEKPSIYIDPYNLAFPDISDLILITSDSDHHCAPEEVKWLRKGATIIIAPETCVEYFQGGDIRVAIPGQEHHIKGALVQVLPAYEDLKDYELNRNTGVGYILTFENGFRIYHCGHTSIVPQFHLDSIDVLLLSIDVNAGLPLSAVPDFVNQINPKVTIPIHWAKENIINKSDFDRLNELCHSEIIVLKAKR